MFIPPYDEFSQGSEEFVRKMVSDKPRLARVADKPARDCTDRPSRPGVPALLENSRFALLNQLIEERDVWGKERRRVTMQNVDLNKKLREAQQDRTFVVRLWLFSLGINVVLAIVLIAEKAQ